MLPALLQPLLLPPLPFGFNFSPSSRCPNGTPGAPHQQQQTAAENIPPDSRDWHGPSAPLPGQRPVAQPVALFMGICKKKKKPKKPNSWQVGDAAGRLSGKGDVWVLVLPGGFWLLRVWEEGGMRGGGSGDNILSLAIRGLNSLNLKQGKQSALV